MLWTILGLVTTIIVGYTTPVLNSMAAKIVNKSKQERALARIQAISEQKEGAVITFHSADKGAGRQKIGRNWKIERIGPTNVKLRCMAVPNQTYTMTCAEFDEGHVCVLE